MLRKGVMNIHLIQDKALGWGVRVSQHTRESITYCADRAAAVKLKRQAEGNASVVEFLLGQSDELPEAV